MNNTEPFQRAFEAAKRRYEKLQNTDIELAFSNGLFFTMRATVTSSLFFKNKRAYAIIVNAKKQPFLSRLSHEDLVGWFGHELAHIVEYESMANMQLVAFILRYVFNLKFRFIVERRVNAYAVNNGFARELFGVWKKFLAMESIGGRYKNYIIRHYKPDWESIREVAKEMDMTKEEYEHL
ncbi:MAG: hypothetical protein JWM20_937 [Patescibacteria group bacterium]|nr:hypothetical protein [Patescibacteria group bacterium]